ncbi:hypothetical protein JVT61DRAFT_6400 [Boletus reticuloceps]|uniref:Uncharacterized protein n=1 Tax=Boletus reticuloceps TaxID=495285 RepID=A0A8I3A7T8_9AGAM|nr:hypothetical protein JVT61DRAFT_6400 [Boletus reticuloceps]
MSLRPVPPPSPRGKKSLSLNTPVLWTLHALFTACFTSPAFPRHVLRHFATHPPTWSWTRKDGPDKDQTSQAPTFPISCGKDDPKAVHWVCHIFHSFRAHLSESSFEADSGRVKKGILLIYQNNMLVHLRGQLERPAPPPLQNSPPKPGGPPSAPAKPPPAKTVEPSDLVVPGPHLFPRGVFSPPSPTAARTVVPTAPPSNPPSPLSSVSTALSHAAHPSHPWLQPILDHKDLPTYLPQRWYPPSTSQFLMMSPQWSLFTSPAFRPSTLGLTPMGTSRSPGTSRILNW